MPIEESLIIGVVRLVPHRREMFVKGRRVEMSDAHFDLLRVLMEQRGRVVTRTTLIAAAWGDLRADRIMLLEQHIDALRVPLLTAGITIRTFPGIGYSIE